LHLVTPTASQSKAQSQQLELTHVNLLPSGRPLRRLARCAKVSTDCYKIRRRARGHKSNGRLIPEVAIHPLDPAASNLTWAKDSGEVFPNRHDSRNEWYEHLGELFQPTDLVTLAHDEDNVEQRALRKPFRDILQRLRLLGISDDSVEREFYRVLELHGTLVYPDDDDDEGRPPAAALRFGDFAALIAALDTDRDGDSYIYDTYQGYERFFRLEVAGRIGLAISDDAAQNAEEALSFMTGYSRLWLLSKNATNLNRDVTWDFAEHVGSGYSTTEEHIRPVRRRHRFLVVTEGTSDAWIIEKALAIRRPAVADFFYFFDLSKETFPFPGHGGIVTFCRGLVTISVLNQAIVVFDNDAVGTASFNATMQMALPETSEHSSYQISRPDRYLQRKGRTGQDKLKSTAAPLPSRSTST
jgi:hypothetical protein